MKKTLLTLSVFLLFISVPAFSQTAQEQANEINAASEEAVQSESATEARNDETAAWEGAEGNSGTPADENAETVDLIGGEEKVQEEQDETSSFETPKTEDVTPWKGLMIGLISTFMGAVGLMLVAATLLACSTTEDVTRAANIRIRIAQALYIVAAAAFGAVLTLATILMVKHGQYLLGGIWAGLATVSIAAAIYMACKCQYPASFYQPGADNEFSRFSLDLHDAVKKITLIGFIMGGIGLLGGGGYSVYSYSKANNTTASESNQSKQGESNTTANESYQTQQVENNTSASDEGNQIQPEDVNQDQQMPTEITE